MSSEVGMGEVTKDRKSTYVRRMLPTAPRRMLFDPKERGTAKGITIGVKLSIRAWNPIGGLALAEGR